MRVPLTANRTFKTLSFEQVTGRLLAAVPEGP